MFGGRHRDMLKLCSWSCLNYLNFCSGVDGIGGGSADRPKTDRFIRPFTISSMTNVKVPSDARLYRDQQLSRTAKGKCKINAERVPLDKLPEYIDQHPIIDADNQKPKSSCGASGAAAGAGAGAAADRQNTMTTKILQNLYVTGIGGIRAKTLKNYKINLLLNASIDLPMIEAANAEAIRVPISEKEPETLTLYLNDVADKIHENYLKNGQTMIYCHDGNRNSMALSVGYLIKYTDLQLSEALLHLQYSRKGFELKNGNLGAFKKPIHTFAKKYKKDDFRLTSGGGGTGDDAAEKSHKSISGGVYSKKSNKTKKSNKAKS